MPDRSKRTRVPSHPGKIIRMHYLEPMGLTVTALAEHLGVSRKTFSAVVSERGSVTPDMALRPVFLRRARIITPRCSGYTRLP